MGQMNHKIILVNPGYGYEPTRLGIEISLQMLSTLQAEAVLVPELNDRFIKLVNKEFPAQPIILSKKLGSFYKADLNDISSYLKHLHKLLRDRFRLEKAIRNALKEGLSGKTQQGKHVQIQANQIVFEIITGSRILATDAPNLFAFQGLLTSILSRACSKSKLFKGRDREVAMKVHDSMLSVESKYNWVFIPSTSPFLNNNHFDHLFRTPITTPPLRKLRQHPLKTFSIEDPSIFVMVSGTGRTSNIDDIAKSLDFPYVISELGDIRTFRRKIDPEEIFGPSVVAVLTRGGAGTHWLCQHARKPQIFLPFQHDDDPEIFFNLQRFVELGVGIIFDNTPLSWEKVNSCSKSICDLNSEAINRFQTLDGIEFIHNSFTSSLPNEHRAD